MRVACVLFSLLAFANAGITVQNNWEIGSNLQHNLGTQEFFVKLTSPESELSLEDHVAVYFNSLDVQQRSLVAEAIKNALEGFRGVIINGSDDIPVLDPFVVDHIGPFFYTATGVRAEANIRNLRVEGLKWFLVDRVDFNAFRLSVGLQITVPWIVTTGSYDARATVAILTHNAGGNFRVFINRLVFSADVTMGANIFGGGSLFLRELDIKIDIHDTLIQLDGMFGSSLVNNFISSLVQGVTQEVIQSQLENVSQTVSEQLFDVINEFLGDFTLADLGA